MRVHELAKELDKSNKEVLDMLKEKGVDVKSHMSSLTDEQVQMIKQPKPEVKPEVAPTPVAKPEVKAEPVAEAKPDMPKKKNFVFRPQNAQSTSRPQGRRPMPGQGQGQGQRPVQGRGAMPLPGQRPTGGQRPAGPVQSPSGKPMQPTRPGATPVQPKPEVAPTPVAKPTPASTTTPVAKPAPTPAAKPATTPAAKPTPAPVATPAQEKKPVEMAKQEKPQAPVVARPATEGKREERREERHDDRREGRRDDGRDGRREDNRDGRREGRRDDRRNDRRNNGPSIPAPMEPAQKPQRQKQKDNYKKKDRDYQRDDEDRAGKPKKGAKNVPLTQKPQAKPVEKVEEKIKMITLPETLTIGELADKMKVPSSTIIKKLFMQGKIVTVNHDVDFETAEEIAMEFEILCEKEEVVDVIEELLKEEEEDTSKMKKRPPVVCVMGHVDHGKTSLLDAIRNTRVTSGEAGGITQHIGAYVATVNGEKITFLDTPGHEAFTAMRMRGANSTDIAILVVAADDGVMPQTVEAISHAKAAGIEIVVAVNKIDKPAANIDRVKQELTEYELIPEDWGGSTIFVPVSAKTGEGIEDLMEMLLLTAEVLELKANANRRARGLVIEAELDKGKGPVATVLVQKGTLRVGDAIAAGAAHGKVRAMIDDKGRRVKEAGPSTPVEILGLDDVPNAGEVFVGCGNDKEARSFAETFIAQNKVKLLDDTKSRMSLDDLFNQIQAGTVKELGIIVKADVQGSVEAVKQSLVKLSNEEVAVKVIHGGVGAINESDVTLASTSNAIIIGFNVRPDATAKEIAEREGVDVRLYRVIYNAIEDVQAAMKGMLDPVFEEKVLGHAEVRQTFKASGVGTIAGSYVLDGIFERGCSARIIRDGIVIFDGALASLKRFKDDVKEVKAGYECGFVFERYNDIKEGDNVEAYKMVEIPR